MEEYSHNLGKNLEGLEKEMETLNAMINELLRRVSIEKNRGVETLHEVQEWISMAEETESKASGLLDESISGYHDLSTYDDISKISESTRHYSEMVSMTLEEVKALKSRGDFKVLVERTPLSYVKKTMLPLQPIDPGEMLPEEAWDFFQEIVGESTLKSHPDIPKLARIVAKKCGGLPIALSLIGATMSHKRTVREWHHAIHVLVSSTREVSSTEDELLPILKFTYDNLHGESIRSCFRYCAMFPKNCDISKQDLVDCWIAEGMIKEEDREIAEIKGYEMISDLVMLRLLIDDESGCGVKMHHMVREMALWIASDCGRQKENLVAVSGMGMHKMPEVNEWRIVRRMSVTCTQVEMINDSPDSPELTTLFLQENSLKWISSDFFQWMTSLVVLNLSRNKELAELPEEVSCLLSLRLLNLSWTKIKRLPLGLKELKRLIHLDLDGTPRLLEVDVIRFLLNLQVLRLVRSVPMDLSLMEDIQLLKSLKELNLTVREVDVLKRLQSIHQLATCIRHLHLTGITINDGGTLLPNSMSSLRKLDIEMCDIPEITVNWRSTVQRERVHFGNIPLLQNVHTVTLSSCNGLRDLTWLILAPNLGNLRLHECQQIERIINKEKATYGMTEQPFQNLTSLSLDSLPQLESIYWAPLPFPVLKDLYVRGCPKLRRLPFNSNSAKGNQVQSDLDQEWIKGVEWEDEATKQHFSYFCERDFRKMAEEQNMDGLTSASQPIKDIVMVETSERGQSSTANSITGENVFQSDTLGTTEHTQTYRNMISNMIATPAPWKQTDGRRLRSVEFKHSGKELRALNEILEAMHTKSVFGSRKQPQFSNSRRLHNQVMPPTMRGPIVIIKAARLVEKNVITTCRKEEESVHVKRNSTSQKVAKDRSISSVDSKSSSSRNVRSSQVYKESTSPRLRHQVNKNENEKRSRPPTTPSDAAKSERQTNRQPEESTTTPGGRHILRAQRSSQQNNDQQCSTVTGGDDGLKDSINEHCEEDQWNPAYSFSETTTTDSFSPEINQKKLQNVEHLVQNLKKLNSSHDETSQDYIASLCENNDPNTDHRYISEILLASGLLLRDLGSEFQLHPSGHPINPEIFLVLEQTKGRSSTSSCNEKLNRKLVFDAVNETLAKKLAFEDTWMKRGKAIKRKKVLSAQQLLKEVCSEIEKVADKIPANYPEDLVVYQVEEEDSMMRMWLDWTDFDGADDDVVQSLVLDLERLLFKDLVSEEVVHWSAETVSVTASNFVQTTSY